MELQEQNDKGFRASLPTTPRGRAELALRVGVDASTVWRWCEGKSIPRSHATRVAIADALDRQVDDLWPVDDEQDLAA